MKNLAENGAKLSGRSDDVVVVVAVTVGENGAALLGWKIKTRYKRNTKGP